MHGGRLATIFSARNYCESHENVCALLPLLSFISPQLLSPTPSLNRGVFLCAVIFSNVCSHDGALALFALDEVGRLQCRFKTLAHVKKQQEHEHGHQNKKQRHAHHHSDSKV